MWIEATFSLYRISLDSKNKRTMYLMGVKHASFTKLHLDKVGQQVGYPWWLVPVILVYGRLKDRQIFSSKIKPVPFTCVPPPSVT